MQQLSLYGYVSKYHMQSGMFVLGEWFVGMIRGMIRGYDSWVWFADLDLVFPRILEYCYLPTLTSKMFQMLVIIPYVERFGAGMLLPLCVLLSVVCTVWSDAGGAIAT